MTNNKAYKWFRTCLYLLPFGLLALVVFQVDFTGVTDFSDVITNALWGVGASLPFPSFASVLNNVFMDVFGDGAIPTWFTSFLAYYAFIYLVDITLGLLLFLPRWINSKFGGDWLD